LSNVAVGDGGFVVFVYFSPAAYAFNRLGGGFHILLRMFCGTAGQRTVTETVAATRTKKIS
jgi:hypothetical protein